MENKPLLPQQQEIDTEDWERTPIAVKKLVVQLSQKIEQLEQHLKELQKSNQELSEKVNRNSKNSNSPPSSDLAKVEKKKTKRTKGKKRERTCPHLGQPGHQGHRRELYPIEECEKVTDYYPTRCKCCGEELFGEDKTPYRHFGTQWCITSNRKRLTSSTEKIISSLAASPRRYSQLE